MRYYRCKCGKSESYGSMAPAACQGCAECGTTLDTSSSFHRSPVPHEFVVEQIKTDEGLKPLSRCRRCLRTKAELEG